eukprot:1181041-Prorocentrum_minimum.AAC.2
MASIVRGGLLFVAPGAEGFGCSTTSAKGSDASITQLSNVNNTHQGVVVIFKYLPKFPSCGM